MLKTVLISALTAALVCSCMMVLRTAEASRNASGTFSLYTPGNPVVTNTTISSSWANNTLSDIKTEITDSLSRSGKGAMLQPLQLYDGTVNLPGLTFGTETATGLYRIGAADIGFAVSAAKVAEFTSTGITIPSGKSITFPAASVQSFTFETNISGAAGIGYWKDPAGIVHIKGTVLNSTGGNATQIATSTPMSAGFRPSGGSRQFPVTSQNNTNLYHAIITTGGALSISASTVWANGVTLNLDGINFLAEQ